MASISVAELRALGTAGIFTEPEGARLLCRSFRFDIGGLRPLLVPAEAEETRVTFRRYSGGIREWAGFTSVDSGRVRLRREL